VAVMEKDVKIPFSLFSRVIELLESIDISEYSQCTQMDYSDVLFALTKKMESIELRDAYARIVFAEDDDARHAARMRYLRQKRDMYEPF
jgi:hypothetical protein